MNLLHAKKFSNTAQVQSAFLSSSDQRLLVFCNTQYSSKNLFLSFYYFPPTSVFSSKTPLYKERQLNGSKNKIPIPQQLFSVNMHFPIVVESRGFSIA